MIQASSSSPIGSLVKFLGLFVLPGFIPLVATGGATNLPGSKPNIIYILADDLGYGDVQCYNLKNGKIHTPNIDRLATQGMRFTDAHTSSSVCTPTRYSILTGRYAWRTRLQSGVLEGFSPPLISSNRMTVASLLQSHGYETAGIGKWHLGLNWQTEESSSGGTNQPRTPTQKPGRTVDWAKPILNGPTSLGFNYFYGIAASLDMPPFVFIDNDHVTAIPTTEKKWQRSGPAAESFEAIDVMPELTQKAEHWLEQRAAGRKPFFLYLAYTAPHTPILPTKEWQGKSALNEYADFVMQTDAAVGQLLAILDRTGLSTNTLVIFTSDNGCSPSANLGQLKAKGHNPSGPWRGHKSDIWEGGHRVPFIARWPGHISAGTTSAETICLSDLLATSAALVGTKLPEAAGEDSVSILPALLGDKPDEPIREATIHHSINGKFAIRRGGWKLALCPGSGGWSGPSDKAAIAQGLPEVQLYNLEADPGESNNVHAKHPDMVKQLTALLHKYVAEGRSTPGAPQRNDVAVRVETSTKAANFQDK